MNALRFAIQAIREAPGRITYLIAIVTVATIAWVLLATLASAFLPAPTSANGSLIGVETASDSQPLPLRYAATISAVPGVRDLFYSTTVVVNCKDGAPSVSVQGFGGSRAAVLRFATIWPRDSPALRRMQRAWFRDPMGILVGAKTAEDCGWTAGIGVAPKNVFSNSPVEIHVTGVLPRRKNPIANVVSFGHYAYLSRLSQIVPSNAVNEIDVFPANARDASAVAARIETALAHSDPPVTATTNVDFNNALARYGAAQYVLGYVMVAVFLCTTLVLISTLVHAVGQRRPQLAVLQVLGFSRTLLLCSLVLEGLAVMAVGGALGSGIGLLVLHLLPTSLHLLLGGLAVPTWLWWTLPLWLAMLLGEALAIPSMSIARLRPIDVRAL